MTRTRSLWLMAVVLFGTLGYESSACAARGPEQPHPNLTFDIHSIEARNAQITIRSRNGQRVLRLTTGHAEKWPGITITPKHDVWDLSSACYLLLPVRNASPTPVTVGLRVDSIDAEGHHDTIQTTEDIAAGARQTLQLSLLRKLPTRLKGKLFGMRGYPGHFSVDHGIDVRHIKKVIIFAAKPRRDHVLEISPLTIAGGCDSKIWYTWPLERLFPMIDRFGQYKFKEWPGKTHSQSDLERRRRAETKRLATSPSPPEWDRFGGWTKGPQLEATGSFRVTKHDGKWWLVDPDGRLFWSHGVDCVRASDGITPITDRRFYFADLPTADSPLAVFYGKMGRAPHGYYAKDGKFDTYNFSGANAFRKYGPDWRKTYNTICHRRLRYWGLNTIGNWSSAEIYRLHQTPYVVTLGTGHVPIEGSSGYWGKFPDPFAPAFAAKTHANARRLRSDILSSWCLGVFVDNELAWGDELSLATATLESPAAQPAKVAAVETLKNKYRDIAALNSVWGTKHKSWAALLQCQESPDVQRAHDDLAQLYTQIAERYFRVCRDAVKQVAPNKLYLGCRFAAVNDRAVRAAAKYCDVISFNKYVYSVADFHLPNGVDAPAIIGEFHFGALDRGLFHTGLRATRNQAARAAAYKNYVRGALQNRYLVGTHWFQFGDQATTGRFDGENYQIGFLDICDTPYCELIDASRKIGNQMYHLRAQPKSVGK